MADIVDEPPPPPPGSEPRPIYYYAPQPYPYVAPYHPAPAPVVVAPAKPYRPHGIYFTESFGGVRIGDDLGNRMDSAFRIRIALGYRRNNLAFELWGGGVIGSSHRHPYSTSGSYLSSSTETPQPWTDDPHDSSGMAMVGFDMKYIKSISRHFEIYARTGLGRGYSASLGSGPGMGIGGGAQLKGKVPVIGFLFWPLFFTGLGPKVTAAVFMDTGYEFYRLHDDVRSTDAQLTHWSVGFAVGSDF